MYKAGRNFVVIFPFIFVIFPSLVIQRISLFIFKQVCFFKKNPYVLLVFFSQVPCMEISGMIPGVNKLVEK